MKVIIEETNNVLQELKQKYIETHLGFDEIGFHDYVRKEIASRINLRDIEIHFLDDIGDYVTW